MPDSSQSGSDRMGDIERWTIWPSDVNWPSDAANGHVHQVTSGPPVAQPTEVVPAEQLEGAVEECDGYRALLDEFASHRLDSSLDWFDGWTRRVLATLAGGSSDAA